MKILYVAPENVTGGFGLYAEGHRKRGNECRWITFFKSNFGYTEDLCFNLWGMPNKSWVAGIRRAGRKVQGESFIKELTGNLPFWKPSSKFESLWNVLRDNINERRIFDTITQFQLDSFDIYHFEQGIDPFRDGRWVKNLNSLGKGIVCFYHGSDLRNRGVIENVHKYSQLNLTSEVDLLSRMPGMKYLYLPIDPSKLPARNPQIDGHIYIGHAARNRKFKGSDYIESVILKLTPKYHIKWVMIENVDHQTALQMKAKCDIFIDQITDTGGWGYGASSVESLSMGIPTVSLINKKVADFLGENPFISADKDSLESQLIMLLENKGMLKDLSDISRSWALERHGIDSVITKLYGYYSEAGLI